MWKPNRFVILALVSVTVALAGVEPVRAGAEDDAIDMYTRMYRDAQRDLEFGNAYERIHAAWLMGQHKNPRFIRPLQRELLKDLTVKKFRKFTVNDPYVKSQIAYALGRIGHKDSIDPLFLALDQTIAIIEDEAKDSAARKERATQLFQQANANKGEPETINQSQEPVVMRPNAQATPARLQPQFRYPQSPDVFWSVADEFKSIPAPDDWSELHDIRMRGYSWNNLAGHIIRAIGDIGDEESLDKMEKYLTYENENIRYQASVAMGYIGTPKAVGLLDTRFDAEENMFVKVGIARSMLYADKTQSKALMFLIDNVRIDDVKVRYAITYALLDLRVGEALWPLRRAYAVEDNAQLRRLMKKAIYYAEVDNILPVNY